MNIYLRIFFWVGAICGLSLTATSEGLESMWWASLTVLNLYSAFVKDEVKDEKRRIQ